MTTIFLAAIVGGIVAIVTFSLTLLFLLTRKPKNKRALSNIVRDSWGLDKR